MVSKRAKNKYPVFIATIIFYFTLFISTSNRTFLLFGVVYFLALYIMFSDIKKALFLSFVATLPFAKGKTINFLLLPKELVIQNPLFDVDYSFPFYLSHLFLFLLAYVYIRRKKREKNGTKIHKSLIFLFLFIYLTAMAAFFSLYPQVIALSALQLILLGFVFYLPKVFANKKILREIVQVLAAFVIFQAIWVTLQRLSGGPLGLDLEVYLPGEEFGVRARENIGIYRSSGTFFEPSILGTFMLMHFFFFLSLFLKKDLESSRYRNLYIVALAAALISMLFTASRGIYLLLFVMTAVFIFFYKKTHNVVHALSRNLRKMLIVVIPIIFIALPFVVARLASIGTLFGPTGSATSRIQLNQYAVRLAQTNPLGVGLNLSPYFFATAFPQEAFTFDPARPHNIFFQVLAETGFLGLVLFVLFIYFVLRAYLDSKDKLKNLEFFMATLAFLLGAQIYPIFTNHPEILSFFFLYLGFLVFREKRASYD